MLCFQLFDIQIKHSKGLTLLDCRWQVEIFSSPYFKDNGLAGVTTPTFFGVEVVCLEKVGL
jgi:hypothetical protein